jgi:hypothetical protein
MSTEEESISVLFFVDIVSCARVANSLGMVIEEREKKTANLYRKASH